jgi:regulator of sigma E protease
MLLSLIGFFVVLGLAVLVHELGHYFAARYAKVAVNTFSIGFGPAIIKWKDKRGTTWKISAVPVGGYVSLYGNEDIFDRKKYDELSAAKKKGHYLSASLWKRILIAGSGVVMNFALAFAIYTGFFAMVPRNVQLPVIGQVIQESVAYNAGVRAGDTVLRIDGTKIANWGDIVLAKELASNRNAETILLRGEELVVVNLSPAERWGMIADGSKTFVQQKNIFGAMYSGAREVWVQSRTIMTVITQIVTGERSSRQLGSIILIAQMSGQALSAGIIALFSLIALLSVNFAVLNLLPLPVLDGGTLLMLAAEGVTRKKIQGRLVEYLFIGGWVFLLLLFALTMRNDIFRLLGW